MDGDTLLLEEAVAELLHKFCDPQVGAVSGCVKVARPGNLLTRWQEVEYAIGQNLDRQALEMINGINTVPGAVGAFRREVLAQVGGYHGDTLAEDTDLTLRIIQAGYRVAYAPKAVALTEAPESARQLIKQRFRWSYGAMQTLWKHRSAFANRQCPGLGWFTLPQVFLFQMLVPFLIPIGDIMMLANFTAMVEAPVLSSGLAFVGLEIGAAWVALLLAGERRRLPYLTLVLLTQRLGYRYFTFIPLVKSYVAATNGRAVGWGYLERLGKVVQQPAA
jgi:cellulose synthase/poly-beta-1,6-N-acetylglucosamine synthase-like glycosyltransferase